MTTAPGGAKPRTTITRSSVVLPSTGSRMTSPVAGAVGWAVEGGTVGARVGVGVGLAVRVGEGVGLGERVGVGEGVGLGEGVGRALALASGLNGRRLDSAVALGDSRPSATATALARGLTVGVVSWLSIEETASRTMTARPVTKARASQSNRPPDRALRLRIEPRTTPVRRAPPAQRGFDLAMGCGGYSRMDERRREA